MSGQGLIDPDHIRSGNLMVTSLLSSPTRTLAAMTAEYRFTASLWPWDAKEDGSWWFVTVPADVSDDIEEQHGASAGGFGSIKVEVTVGATTWRTSLFPSSQVRAYVLPVKKAVRTAEGLAEGTSVPVSLVCV
jgi:hypothetical protein